MNPHGLHDPEHYTTARDLAMIARAAIQEPRIAEVVRTRHTRIARSIDKRDVTLYNHSRFLGRFPGADGIKTGWTVPAGKCYVGSVTQNGWRLISVVLKSPDYVHETALLMRYGYANFEPHVLAHAGDTAGSCPLHGGASPVIPAVVKSRVQVVLPKHDTSPVTAQIQYFSPSAPISTGTVVGLYKGAIANRVICAVPIVAAITIPRAPTPNPNVTAAGHTRHWLYAASFFVLCLVSLRHGARITSITKSARRRGRRLAKSLRGDHLAR
jgi:D-alanyl-D-alanine carboxypeptidase (penicillin-binding protein 5/6)